MCVCVCACGESHFLFFFFFLRMNGIFLTCVFFTVLYVAVAQTKKRGLQCGFVHNFTAQLISQPLLCPFSYYPQTARLSRVAALYKSLRTLVLKPNHRGTDHTQPAQHKRASLRVQASAMVVAIEEPFPAVRKCDATRRGDHTVVSDLDGTLLRSRSAFPYYALVAFETGGVPRLALLLLLAPLAGLLYHAVSESAGVRVLVFAATAGARVADIESAARAVLPRFYADDVHPDAWRVFAACGRRWVVTATPRVMAEPFLREHLGADAVAGTELATWRGRATGLVDSRRGVLVGERKVEALREMVGDGDAPEVGLGDRRSDYAFMSVCKVT